MRSDMIPTDDGNCRPSDLPGTLQRPSHLIGVVRCRPAIAAFALLLAVACARSVGATPIFLVDSSADSSVVPETLIFRVDRATGQLTTLGTLPTEFGEVAALAAASDNLLYAAATRTGDILEITASPFGFRSIGSVVATNPVGLGANNIVGLAFSGGVLYAIDEATDELSRIQITPFNATVIGQVRLGSIAGPVLDVFGGDIAEDASGNWFLWTQGDPQGPHLYRLDVTAAVATELDPTNQTLGAKTGIAFDYQGGGALLASSGVLDALLTLNPATGETTASVPFCLNCPTPYDHRFGDLASPRCTDADQDGFAPEGGDCGPVDCNDDDPSINPAAEEVCNGIDDNCDGTIDEDPAASAACVASCMATTAHDCHVEQEDRHVEDEEPSEPSEAPSSRSDDEEDSFHSESARFTDCQTSLCQAGSCSITAGACSDDGSSPCTTDAECDDGNPCTDDRCDPSAHCLHVPLSGGSCDDRNPCTHDDTCTAGVCVGIPVHCTGGDHCDRDGMCSHHHHRHPRRHRKRFRPSRPRWEQTKISRPISSE